MTSVAGHIAPYAAASASPAPWARARNSYLEAEPAFRARPQAMQLTGLHHVTAITAQAADNLAFYTRVLGLRLVKKTVNQGLHP